MAAYISPLFGAGFQAFNNQGVVLAGGKIYTYVAGTTNAQATWTSSTQSVQNSNPIVLDSAGRVPTAVWLQGGVAYKFVLTDSNGNTIGTYDNVPGVNDANFGTFSEWVVFGSAPTYVSASQFTVSGNQTTTFQVNRRVQFFQLSGTFYGTITASSYSAGTGLTTVTINADSTGLASTLSSVAYGFMSATNTSLPAGSYASTTSPTFTGNPVAPTPTAGDNDTSIATTAFVQGAVNGYSSVNVAGSADVTLTTAQYSTPIIQLTGTLTGNINVNFPNQSGWWYVINSTSGAFTVTCRAGVSDPGVTVTQGTNKPLVSNVSNLYVGMTDYTGVTFSNVTLSNPTMTGTVTVPTQSPGDNSTKAASTAFVTAAIAALSSTYLTQASAASTYLTQASAASNYARVNAGNSFSSTQDFTGATVTVPTQAPGDSSTKAASTAFVATQAFNTALPNQTGNSGKFVTTDGTVASWANVLPTQTGNNGKALVTNGTTASWGSLSGVTPINLLASGAFALASSLGTLSSIQAIPLDATHDLILMSGSSSLHAVVCDLSAGTFGTAVLVRTGAVADAYIGYGVSSSQVLVCSAITTAYQAVVLSVSGTTITVNTAAPVTLSGNISKFCTEMVACGTSYIAAYTRATTTGGMLAHTISGTTVTVGSEVTTGSATLVSQAPVLYSLSASAYLVLFHNNATTNIVAFPGTVSGSTITGGTLANIPITAAGFLTCVLSTSRVALTYSNTNTFAAVISVSANVATATTVQVYAAAGAGTAIVPIGSGRAIVLAPNPGVNVITDTAGTVSAGTSFALGSPQLVKYDSTSVWIADVSVVYRITNSTADPTISAAYKLGSFNATFSNLSNILSKRPATSSSLVGTTYAMDLAGINVSGNVASFGNSLTVMSPAAWSGGSIAYGKARQVEDSLWFCAYSSNVSSFMQLLKVQAQ